MIGDIFGEQGLIILVMDWWHWSSRSGHSSTPLHDPAGRLLPLGHQMDSGSR